MILKLAEIDVTPGSEQAFEAAVARAKSLFDVAAGCLGIALHRSIEAPGGTG